MIPTADPDPLGVVIVVYPGVLGLDVVGPLDVFALANRFGARPAYAPTVVSMAGGPVALSSGLTIGTAPAGEAPESVDTLVVAGGYSVGRAAQDEELVGWLRSAAGSARRVASVCTGAILLARTGVLDGRRATTHWSVCELLAGLHPSVDVDPEPIFVRDDHVWTSAGVTAGMDLALALVGQDHGPELASTIAREMVMFVQRPGGQSQISNQLAVPRPVRSPFLEVLALVAEHPEADLSVSELARRSAMSVRTFSRRFREEVGTTPAAYVQSSRVEAARRLLETTESSLEHIARACGFGTVETMHRAFRRTVATTPARFRPVRTPNTTTTTGTAP